VHTFIAIVFVVVVVVVVEVVVIVSSNIYYAKREITESEQSTEQTTLTTNIGKNFPHFPLFYSLYISPLDPVIKPNYVKAENMHFSPFPRLLNADEQMLIRSYLCTSSSNLPNLTQLSEWISI